MDSGLDYQLAAGFEYGGEYIKDVTLLKSNGISEKVYTEKIAEKPYTWQAKVITVSLKSLGSVEGIGSKARSEYLDDRDFSIPDIVKAMPLADASSAILEIHRRVWKNLLKRQENICNYCTKKLYMDIDLDRCDYTSDDKAKIENTEVWKNLTANLPDGWTYEPLGKGEKKLYEEYGGINFNRFVFRIPTLRDAIEYEAYTREKIDFWRRIAFNCLISIQAVSEDGAIEHELPIEAKTKIGLRIFEQILSSKDLQEIRSTVRDQVPSLLFAYEEECGCSEKRIIPVSADAGSFFSD